MLINLEGSSLLHFSALCGIFRKKKIQKFQVFFPKKMFCAFLTLDIAPTLDVLVLFEIKTFFDRVSRGSIIAVFHNLMSKIIGSIFHSMGAFLALF